MVEGFLASRMKKAKRRTHEKCKKYLNKRPTKWLKPSIHKPFLLPFVICRPRLLLSASKQCHLEEWKISPLLLWSMLLIMKNLSGFGAWRHSMRAEIACFLRTRFEAILFRSIPLTYSLTKIATVSILIIDKYQNVTYLTPSACVSRYAVCDMCHLVAYPIPQGGKDCVWKIATAL